MQMAKESWLRTNSTVYTTNTVLAYTLQTIYTLLRIFRWVFLSILKLVLY